MKLKLNKKRFENNLNKNNQNFQDINAVQDNEQEKYLNVFEMIDLLNELHEEKEQLKRQINYNAECLTAIELNYIKLKEQHEHLKTIIIGLVENGLKELFGEKYRLIEDISDKEINDEQDNQINKSIKNLVKENNQLQKELFESEYENICEQYYSNPIHKDEAIKNLKIDFKKRFGRTFELEY